MKKPIYVPGSFWPLHLWHEQFIEKLVSKTNNDIYFSIKWWEKIIKIFLDKNNDWKFNENLRKLNMKEKFLGIQNVFFMLNILYPDFLVWNDTRNEIIWEDFDGIALWSDQFLKILNAIRLNKISSFKFKKIYFFKRKWFPVWDYNYILKSSSFDLEVIELWQSSYELSSSKIIEMYYEKGLPSIQNMVSEPIYKFLRDMVECDIKKKREFLS